MASSKQDDSLTTYPITVNYERSLNEMVMAGHYDSDGDFITADKFPIEGSGTVELDCVLVHLGRDASTEEVKSEMAEHGLRPAAIEELLAFGETYPDVQREFFVVELGSVWVDSFDRCGFPCLWGDSLDRSLGHDWYGGSWDSSERFLAVRE